MLVCFLFPSRCVLRGHYKSETDAHEGLQFMHGAGIARYNHTTQNILICRLGDPTGFVGKTTDPGVRYGESGSGSEANNRQQYLVLLTMAPRNRQ